MLNQAALGGCLTAASAARYSVQHARDSPELELKEMIMDTPVEHVEHDDRAAHRSVIAVNDRDYSVTARAVSGRDVLRIADKRPEDDYIIYWLNKDNVLQDLALDREVHLQHDGIERFLAFDSDRSFRFEVDGKREDWGAPTITEETLRKLAGVGFEYRVWLDQQDVPDRLIGRGEFVDLNAPGIEKFYTELVYTITVVNEENGHEFKLEETKHAQIASVIEEIYRRLGLPRRSDDRLRCEEGGADVFGFASLSLGQYIEAGHCRCLVWLFVGGTGGALCR
jgi:hypothetical protein